MTIDLNQAALSDSEQQDVMETIASIHLKLSFLINMTQAERRSLAKVGDKTRVFVQKAMEVVNRNDEFLPRSFDVDEMRRAVKLYESLYPILLSLGQLHELLEDTYYVAANEAYASARVVYQSAKAHGRGIGVDTVVEELGTRFSRKSRKSPPQTR
ncbi:MAG: hypothetical protein HC878_03270 [Leptolyngbyaceae cyanobacterium SL_5_14]|nr:hypothetical protein [Leptolyngbyaceae cyanobacterium SL_5_14]